MKCLACGTENVESATRCIECGVSLRPARAQRHLDEAEGEIAQGRYEQATAQISRADREMLPLRQEQRDQYLLNARAFFLQAAIYYDRGRILDSRQELQLARANLEPLPQGKMLLAQVFNRLGNSYYYTNDFAEALDCYQKSVPLALANGLYLLAIKAISNMGNLYVSMGQRDQAREVFDQAAALANQHTDAAASTVAYATLVRFHSNDGLHPLALEYADKVLAVYQDVPDISTRYIALADVITINTNYGYLSQAEGYLRTLYELVHNSANYALLETVSERIAELVLQVGEPNTWYVSALKELNILHKRARSNSRYLWEMAVYHVTSGDREHIRHHLAALKRSTPDKEQGSEMFRDSAYALLNTALGEWDEAEGYFQSRLDSAESSFYQRANTLEQYAKMLIQRQAAEPSEENRAKIKAALTEAATIFGEMQSPLRVERVNALLYKELQGSIR